MPLGLEMDGPILQPLSHNSFTGGNGTPNNASRRRLMTFFLFLEISSLCPHFNPLSPIGHKTGQNFKPPCHINLKGW